MNATQEAVNDYTSMGYSVIPVGPDKRPLVTWAEYQERRPTKDELRAWFGGDEPPSVGIVCGTVSGGLAVVDLDDLDVAQATACDLELQTATTLIETPSGGCHCWLQETGTTSHCCPLKDASGNAIGDLKGEGGYVVAPPSPGYKFISKAPPAKVGDAWAWAADTLKGVGVELRRNGHGRAEPLPERIPVGQRATTLTSLAGSMRRRGASEAGIFAALLVENGRCDSPLAQDELERIARSIAKYPPPEVVAVATIPPAPEGQESKDTLPVVSLAQLRARHTGEVAWIVPGYLARGELGFLAGAGESLKSWTAVHLAAAIDGRFRWLGVFDVAAERVLYVEMERANNLVYQLNRIEAAERVTLGSERFLILPPLPLPLSEDASLAALEATTGAFRPDVVIVNALLLGRR